jgi:hypothetical protein
MLRRNRENNFRGLMISPVFATSAFDGCLPPIAAMHLVSSRHALAWHLRLRRSDAALKAAATNDQETFCKLE